MARTFAAADAAALLPVPAVDAHKYSRGCLTVVGGCARFQGAAVLASMAAPKVGAGYTRLVTPGPAAGAARAHLVSVPVEAVASQEGYLCEDALLAVRSAFVKASAALVGPGMGYSGHSSLFLKRLLAEECSRDMPLVLDADALNIIAHDQKSFLDARRGKPQVITPHEGEASRLLIHTVEDRESAVLKLARDWDCIAVLKGPQTLVASPDGKTVSFSNAGPELAKAGSGDVLAGIIAGLLAQGLDCMDAACLGVYLHGNAGAVAAAKHGIISVTPEDVVESIPSAILGLAPLNPRLAALQEDAERRAQAL